MIEVTKYWGDYEVIKRDYYIFKHFIETHPKEETPASCLRGYERREEFVKKFAKLVENS